jgi:methionyl-tRNA formyltransferase
MRIAFFGTPSLASDCLRALLCRYTVSMVVTGPDTRKGRGLRLTPSPVKQEALQAGLPVYQPASLPGGLPGALRRHGVDVSVVVAYGRILPGAVINAPRLRSVNLHASLLPRHRGPSPVEAALLQGDPVTGLTLQLMEEAMDAGPILAQVEIPLDDEMNARDLYGRMRALAPGFLAERLGRYAAGGLAPREQDHREATYCGKIRKQDGWIDWKEPSRDVLNRIRALALWPVAFTTLDGMLLRVHRAAPCAGPEGTGAAAAGGMPAGAGTETPAGPRTPGMVLGLDRWLGVVVRTGDGCLRLLELQPENRRKMGHREFINGYRGIEGKLLGAQKR